MKAQQKRDKAAAAVEQRVAPTSSQPPANDSTPNVQQQSNDVKSPTTVNHLF
jgi:hypothetical protein